MGMSFDHLTIGQTASFSKTITETDVGLFAGITGDFNPLHVSQPAAEASRFGGRIAHGMLSASLICTVLGMQLPGPGTIHLGQTLRFVRPVRLGDTVTASAEIIELIGDKRRVRLKTMCTNQNGDVVVEGEALVMVSDE
jgi:3-hydroxybutyryl-CoA dehydratase